MARVKEQQPRLVDENDLMTQAKEYVFLKKQLEYLEKQQKELREKLFSHLENSGDADSDGHIVLELPQEIEGVVAIKKQRRVTRKINEEAAETVINQKGLQDKLYKTIRVVDEDALMAALYNDELTEEEIDVMYPQNITWALILNKS